eukprot:SAG31_NODE_225_length_19846_cov_19.057983_20_plen_79_part_00
MHAISRMSTCTGEAGASTKYYEKPLDKQVHLGHAMGSHEHSSIYSTREWRDQKLLNSHRLGTETMDAARFKFFAAGVT